jgi:mono/diheme cytochrome c family protein
VYPEFASTCAPCHASGANGAPQMMTAPADTAYSQLDALGLIQSGSLLLSKGSHDNGAAPALTTQEQTDVETWLGMEAQERAGSAAPTNILQQVGMCVSETDWDNIGWKKLLTQPRTNENPNKCSGCNYALCASCHTSGEQGFYMDLGTAFDPDGSIAFQQSFTGTMMQSYVIQYFGLNGTTPIASNGIMNKQTAVATGAPYSHPMFVMPQTMVTALNTMVTNAITKYNAHECGGDAGASGDGGP